MKKVLFTLSMMLGVISLTSCTYLFDYIVPAYPGEEENGGNAFDRLSETGASSNAFTSFDMTAYLYR